MGPIIFLWAVGGALTFIPVFTLYEEWPVLERSAACVFWPLVAVVALLRGCVGLVMRAFAPIER